MSTILSATVSVRVRRRRWLMKPCKAKHLQCLKPKLKVNRKNMLSVKRPIAASLNSRGAASVCAIAVAVWQFTPQTSRDAMPVAEKSNTQPAQNIIPVSGTLVIKRLQSLVRLLCRMRQKTANLKTVLLFAPSSKMSSRLLCSKK